MLVILGGIAVFIGFILSILAIILLMGAVIEDYIRYYIDSRGH